MDEAVADQGFCLLLDSLLTSLKLLTATTRLLGPSRVERVPPAGAVSHLRGGCAQRDCEYRPS